MRKLLVLVIPCTCFYGILGLPAPWPSGYSYSANQYSFTDGFTRKYTAWVSESKKEARIDIMTQDSIWPNNTGASLFLYTKSPYSYERYVYNPSFIKQESEKWCMLKKSVSQNWNFFYRLPRVSGSSPKFHLNGTYKDGNGTLWERWFRRLEGPYETTETVVIKYEKDPKKQKPIPVLWNYDKFSSSGVAHTRFTIRYYEYTPKEPKASVLKRPTQPTKCVDGMFGRGWSENRATTDKGGLEETTRAQAFRERKHMVEAHNSRDSPYKLELNEFAHMTEDELRDYVRCDLTQMSRGQEEEVEEFPKAKLPSQFDWRLYGAVTSVKSQRDCGSCWAHATVGAMEGFYSIKTGNLTVFSEQMLLDCFWGPNSQGCGGGSMEHAFDWIKKHGILRTSDYGPYLAVGGYCHLNYPKSKFAYLKSYSRVASKDGFKNALVQHGPIAIHMSGWPPELFFYKSGIFSEHTRFATDPPILDSSQTVTLVGYGLKGKKEYWIIKNSWGRAWGDDGYLLLDINSKLMKFGYVPTN